MKSVRTVLAGLCAMSAMGCATLPPPPPFNGHDTAVAISADLAIPLDALRLVGRCEVAVLKDPRRLRPPEACLYVETPKHALLVSYDGDARKYRQLVLLDASIVKQVGLAKALRAIQVQAYTASAIYTFDVEMPPPREIYIDHVATTAAYEHLRSLGIPGLAKPHYIPPGVPVLQ